MSLDTSGALRIAEQHLIQGNLSDAIGIYRQIVATDPSNLIMMNRLGELCVRADRVGEAVQVFSDIARICIDTSQNAKAIAVLKKVLKLDPSNAESLMALGTLYAKSGLAVEGERHFLQAAELFGRSGHSTRALEACQAAAEITPSNTQLQMKLGEMCRREGKPDPAHRAFMTAATEFRRQGDANAALDAYGRALKVVPSSIEAAAAIADLVKTFGLSDSDEPAADSAAPRNDAPPSSNEIAAAAQSKGANGAAQSADDAFVVGKISKAEILFGFGQMEQAVALLKDVARARPGDSRIHKKLKDIYLRSGNQEKAAEEYLELARIFEMDGDSEYAADCVASARGLSPEVASSYGGTGAGRPAVTTQQPPAAAQKPAAPVQKPAAATQKPDAPPAQPQVQRTSVQPPPVAAAPATKKPEPQRIQPVSPAQAPVVSPSQQPPPASLPLSGAARPVLASGPTVTIREVVTPEASALPVEPTTKLPPPAKVFTTTPIGDKLGAAGITGNGAAATRETAEPVRKTGSDPLLEEAATVSAGPATAGAVVREATSRSPKKAPVSKPQSATAVREVQAAPPKEDWTGTAAFALSNDVAAAPVQKASASAGSLLGVDMAKEADEKAAKAKSGKGMYAAVAVVVLLGAGAAGYFVVRNRAHKPQPVPQVAQTAPPPTVPVALPPEQIEVSATASPTDSPVAADSQSPKDKAEQQKREQQQREQQQREQQQREQQQREQQQAAAAVSPAATPYQPKPAPPPVIPGVGAVPVSGGGGGPSISSSGLVRPGGAAPAPPVPTAAGPAPRRTTGP
ncbi:MAG TPA: tetratricopeptide repeat protein, partial [Blastocatellia bacterium]|nr:tetratricopeptide repeat protein [Blastocatellia bacterium]